MPRYNNLHSELSYARLRRAILYFRIPTFHSFMACTFTCIYVIYISVYFFFRYTLLLITDTRCRDTAGMICPICLFQFVWIYRSKILVRNR